MLDGHREVTGGECAAGAGAPAGDHGRDGGRGNRLAGQGAIGAEQQRPKVLAVGRQSPAQREIA